MRNMSYVKFNGEVVFVEAIKANTMFSLNIEGKKIYFPQFRSWSGLEGWTKQAMEAMPHIPANVIALAMRSPAQDFEWLLDVHEEVRQEMLRHSPFGMDITLDNKRVWYEKFRKDISFGRFVHLESPELFDGWRQYKKAYNMAEKHQPYNVRDFLKQLSSIKGWEFKPEAVLVEACKWCFPVKSSSFYWEDRWLRIEEVVSKLSVSPQDICKKKGIGLSRKEAHEFILEAWTPNTTDIFQAAMLWKFQEIPELWYQHIQRAEGFTNSTRWTLVEWVARNSHHLSKDKAMYLPEGRVEIIHMHYMIEHVTHDMLVTGSKTAWRRVEAALEERAKEMMEEKLKDYVVFPEFPHKPPVNIKQLLSSWELRDEGSKMGHCVGGYVDYCKSGRSYIFHIDDLSPGGATAEVCPSGSGWTIAQVRGVKNAPAERAFRIISTWLEKENKKSL